jgi:hypothetical protein
LDAHSLAWIASGNSADVYANASSHLEQVGATGSLAPDVQRHLMRERLRRSFGQQNAFGSYVLVRVFLTTRLRTRLVEWRAIKQIMRHEHEPRPHQVGGSDPVVAVVEHPVFVARVMVK